MPFDFPWRRPRRAFSLIELITAIVVLGLLAALAVPALRAVVDRSETETRQMAVVAVFREAEALAAFRGNGRWIVEDFEQAAADTAATTDVVAAAGQRWTVIVDDDVDDETSGTMGNPLDADDELALEISADGTKAGVAARGAADGEYVHVAARVGDSPKTGLGRETTDNHGNAALALLDGASGGGGGGTTVANEIVMTWDTTLTGCTDTTISLPLSGTVNATVDWGDETAAETVTTAGPAHTYATSDSYTVTVEGTFEKLSAYDGGSYVVANSDDMKCLASVDAWTGDTGTTSTASALYVAANVTAVAAPPPGVTNMQRMFAGAESFNGSVAGWDTSQVTDMTRMFHGASSFSGSGLAGWDVSQVTSFDHTFYYAGITADLSGWTTTSATTMAGMFAYASAFNQDLSNWDVSNVTDMDRMFRNADSFNGDISIWETRNVTNMYQMFAYASAFNQDLSNWDVSNVTNYSYFDLNATSWTLDRPIFP